MKRFTLIVIGVGLLLVVGGVSGSPAAPAARGGHAMTCPCSTHSIGAPGEFATGDGLATRP